MIYPVILNLMAESLRQAGTTTRCSPGLNLPVVSESVSDAEAVVVRDTETLNRLNRG